jgi:hypothetical protein
MNTETSQIFTTKEHKELKEKFFISAFLGGLCVLVVKNLFQ